MPDPGGSNSTSTRSRSFFSGFSRAADLSTSSRLVVCPECHESISERDEPAHLVTVHGYLALAGSVLPRPAAISCLWDRVFRTGDVSAHERLCRLLSDVPDGETGRSPYVVSLESELSHRLDGGRVSRQDLQRWINALRKYPAACDRFWDLVQSSDVNLRRLGQELLLPDVGRFLSSRFVPASEVRRWLDKLCPGEDVWDKIRICQRLPRFGAAARAVQECLHDLHGARPVACPACRIPVPQEELEWHLRAEHQIYQFRGVQGTRPEVIRLPLKAVCSAGADEESWRMLEALAQEQYGTRSIAFLVVQLTRCLHRQPASGREEAIASVAELIAGSRDVYRFIRRAVRSSHIVARHLGLAAVVRLPPPPPEKLMAAVRPALARRRAPAYVQIEAAAALLRTTGTSGPGAQAVVDALLAGCHKVRSLERLRQLEQLAGSFAILTSRHAAIENEIEMRCPRCAVSLRRPKMIEHLWAEHALLLYRGHVRPPWRLIREWIAEYRRTKKHELIDRCRGLGAQLDPEHGLHAVYRLLLENGINDVEANQVLMAEARQHRASLCPRCYADTPIPDPTAVRPVNQSRGRLSLDGYLVEVRESRLRPRLTLQTPRETLYRGPEPGGGLTLSATVLLSAGPLLLLALVFALLYAFGLVSDNWPVLLCVILGTGTYIGVRIWWRNRPRAGDRALDHAWSQLAPRLHEGNFSAPDSAFLAGLAVVSHGRGQRGARAESLERVLRLTANSVAGGSAPVAHLAALRRLAIADAAAAGEDAMRILAAEIARCFRGELPLTYAQSLLTGWPDAWWKPGNRARLRILLADEAFTAGREMCNVPALSIAAPALAEALQAQDGDALARLRLLWSLRPHRPWQPWSEAKTVFELVDDPRLSRPVLERHPDLLWLDPGNLVLFITGQGIVFENTLFTSRPQSVNMKIRRQGREVYYEVIIDEHRFAVAHDPHELIDALDHWFDYHFQAFLPQVAGVYQWQPPDDIKPLQFQEAVACPECGRLCIPKLGQPGTPVDVSAER
jgi:hypothetical protein